MVGPGMTRSTADAAAKAAQVSSVISASLSDEEDHSRLALPDVALRDMAHSRRVEALAVAAMNDADGEIDDAGHGGAVGVAVAVGKCIAECAIIDGVAAEEDAVSLV